MPRPKHQTFSISIYPLALQYVFYITLHGAGLVCIVFQSSNKFNILTSLSNILIDKKYVIFLIDIHCSMSRLKDISTHTSRHKKYNCHNLADLFKNSNIMSRKIIFFELYRKRLIYRIKLLHDE